MAAGDTYVYEPTTSFDEARAMWLGPDPSETWLALTDGDDELVGFFHIEPNHGGPGAHIANASYMVSGASRGKGYGRALVVDSIRRAAERGYLGMQFNAVAASNVHAIGLYRDLGFVTVGVIPDGFRHPTAGWSICT